MTSYAVSVQNTLKLSLALSALASNTLKFGLRRKNHVNFGLRLRRAEKYAIFASSCGLAPSGKSPAGAHGCAAVHIDYDDVLFKCVPT